MKPRIDWRVAIGTVVAAVAGVGGIRGVGRTARTVVMIFTNTGWISGVRRF